MNSESKNSEQSYSDQLSEFEGRLKQTMDDAALLQDVHRAIRELLKERRNSEADIRQILLSRFENGALCEESFQLVRTMLDRIIADDTDTLPGVIKSNASVQENFAETDVIATQTLDSDLPEDRLQIGSVLRDRFLLQEQVTGGSMGVVYKERWIDAWRKRMTVSPGWPSKYFRQNFHEMAMRYGHCSKRLQKEDACRIRI